MSRGGHEDSEEAPETVGKDAEIILNHPPGTGTPVVEDTFIVREVPVGEGLHQVWSQWERVIADEQVWHIVVVVGEWLRGRETKSPFTEVGLKG